MGQINTNNYPIVDSLLDDDLLIVENATNGTGTTTPKQLRENAIGTNPLETTAQTVTGAINELKNSGALPETPLSIAHGGTGNVDGYIRTGALSGSTIGTKATAEGYNTTASGNYSHASGYYTQAKYNSQTAIGKYNNNMSDTLFEVGNGTGPSAKSNALEVYSDGRVHTNKLIIGNDNQVGANTVTGIAMGAGVTAGYENQVAVGVANNNRSDTLFEVGNGSLRGQHKNAFEVYSNGNIKAQGTVSDVNGTLNAVTANPSDTASTDLTKIKIGNTTYNISGGSGNTKVKTLYELYASSWSSAPNSDGFYTAQVTLNPTLNPDVVPNILLAGSSASAQPTDTFRTMFSYVERGYMTGSTLTLYAKTKPTSLFKFWVEGVTGSGTLAVACNIIQPNGAVSGGGLNLTLIKTITIERSDWTQGTDNNYTSLKSLTDVQNAILSKRIFVEVYETNTANGFYKKSTIVSQSMNTPVLLNDTESGVYFSCGRPENFPLVGIDSQRTWSLFNFYMKMTQARYDTSASWTDYTVVVKIYTMD